jgi:hypothetical protein
MWNRLLSSPLLFVYIVFGTLLSTAIGFLFGNRIVLPVLQIVISYPVLYSLLVRRLRNRAFVAMLIWAFCMGVITVIASIQFPDLATKAILHGPEYAAEMLHWIKTGEGAEGNPWQFVPQHLLHFVVFAILSLLTGSLLSLLMGAILMNYMSFYVASVIRLSHDTLLASLMGWHPWAIIRVAAFILLGVILAEPMICRINHMDYEYATARRYYWMALHGLVLDVILKTALAPWWGLELRKLIL